jgi:GDP-4-dehydro-6-deoxy-D-mannose reductase
MISGSKQRILVTGGHGFVGRHFVDLVRTAQPDWDVIALGSPGGPDGVDVTDAEAVAATIKAVRPTALVHLAAVSAVTASLADPDLAWKVNLWGTLNITRALAAWAPDCHLLFVSSAEVYGLSLQTGEPVDERALLQPVNPYAASKASADLLVRQCAARGQPVTVARPFNHTGVGQSELFAAPAFAAQIARIEKGLQAPVIEVGDLSDERDFLAVEDVTRAYLLILENRAITADGRTYNVASGKPLRIGAMLEILCELSTEKLEVRVDPSRVRVGGVRSVIGDATRLRSELGWAPTVRIEDTLKSLLDAQRALARPAA